MLGLHTDGGRIEQWENPPYRNVWALILEGGEGWRGYDPFDVSSRLAANHNLHNTAVVHQHRLCSDSDHP